MHDTTMRLLTSAENLVGVTDLLTGQTVTCNLMNIIVQAVSNPTCWELAQNTEQSAAVTANASYKLSKSDRLYMYVSAVS